MEKYIIFVTIIIYISIIIIAYMNFKKYKGIKKRYKKLKTDYNLLMDNNESFMTRNLVEKETIIKICKDIQEILDKSKKNINSETLKYELTLKELCNNIEVIISDEMSCNDVILNINDMLKKIKYKQIIYQIADNVPNDLILDEIKFLSALKLIIKNSVNDDFNNQIKISVELLEKKNLNIKLKIIIENIKFSNHDYQVLDDFFKSRIIKNIKDYDLLIIRANLLCLKSKISVCKHKGINYMTIEIPVKKQKENRKKPRALIVDDSKQTAIMNQEVIKEIGLDADIVFSPEDCLEIIKKNMDDYDIVITDNQMPKMNGTDLIRELKEIEGFSLPVVIVTGDSNDDSLFTEYYGFDGYIQKPLDKKKAETQIKKLIKQNKF